MRRIVHDPLHVTSLRQADQEVKEKQRDEDKAAGRPPRGSEPPAGPLPTSTEGVGADKVAEDKAAAAGGPSSTPEAGQVAKAEAKEEEKAGDSSAGAALQMAKQSVLDFNAEDKPLSTFMLVSYALMQERGRSHLSR